MDSLIRSKAAMFTILETLTATVGVRLEEITTFYVAGHLRLVYRPGIGGCHRDAAGPARWAPTDPWATPLWKGRPGP